MAGRSKLLSIRPQEDLGSLSSERFAALRSVTIRMRRLKLLFVTEYIKTGDPAKAARAIGFKTAEAARVGRRFMNDPEVARHIEDHLRVIAQKTHATVERTLMELARVAFSNVTDAVAWGDERVVDPETGRVSTTTVTRFRDSRELSADATAAIAAIEVGPHGAKVRMHNKGEALNALAKHFGIMKERVEVSGSLLDVVISMYNQSASPPPAIDGHVNMIDVEDQAHG